MNNTQTNIYTTLATLTTNYTNFYKIGNTLIYNMGPDYGKTNFEKLFFKIVTFNCIELKAQNFYKIMEPWDLLFDIN